MEEELELKEIVEIVYNKKWWIVIGALTGALIAFLYTVFFITPQYSSNTTLMVNSSKANIVPDFDLSSLNLSQKIVVTYSEIVKSRIVLEPVIEKLNLDMTYSQLLHSVSAKPVNATEILKIEVTNGDKDKAALIANTISDVFVKEVIRIMQVNNVEIIDRAIPNEKPINVKVVLNVAIGTIISVMIVIFMIFFMKTMDRSIKNYEDVNKYLELPVIGGVIDFEDLIKKGDEK